MAKDDLKTIFADKSGFAAYNALKTALISKKQSHEMIGDENAFILAASLILQERIASNNYITGTEKRSHAVLHKILTIYNLSGLSGLRALELDCKP